MNRIVNCSMADLEFSSISGFLQKVEAGAEMKQISSSAIFSFKVPKGGIELLIARKENLLLELIENNRKLSVWVEGQANGVDPLELVVLRSMYVTNKNSIELVRDHVVRAKALRQMYKNVEQLSFGVEEEVTDEPPF